MITIFTNSKLLHLMLCLGLIVTISACNSSKKADENHLETEVSDVAYHEPHRLQYHFSPDSMWMNDPNGMVYLDGEYHLFYQHYPDSNVWGPMHWGHAVSKDLVHWEHLPIALYPDSLGYIFSGSAVFDKNNTSDLGTSETPPMVAIFTIHDMEAERAGKVIDETQGIAFSTDKGRTWTKYDQNPVLKNPGIEDFRDPKVFWHEETSKWIMVLAVKDRVHLYSSSNLKEWQKESEFGVNAGAHGGVWECPDLFPLTVEGETKWVMFVSINPGGPNGGSATQYFIGDFDGHQFTAEHEDIRWLDYGPDSYAGVTWSNVDDRRVFLGWMSNWLYAQVVPTYEWRSAMTVARTLKLTNVKGETYVTSQPVKELETLYKNTFSQEVVKADSSLDINKLTGIQSSLFDMSFKTEASPFEVKLSNTKGEFVLIGYDAENNEFYIDRSKSGKKSFSGDFARRNTAKRISNDDSVKFRLLVDVGSVELFTNDGEVVMTSLFFPNEEYSQFEILTKGSRELSDFRISEMKSIWD